MRESTRCCRMDKFTTARRYCTDGVRCAIVRVRSQPGAEAWVATALPSSPTLYKICLRWQHRL